MTIEKFLKIQDEGLFQDFVWPNNLDEFSKINLIYGWNGTGKTTLSRLMNKLGREVAAKSTNIEVKVDGKNLKASEFIEQEHNIKVFNRDFIDKNIMTRGHFDQIVFLGKNVENQKRIEKKEELSFEKIQEKFDHEDLQKKASKKLDTFCTDEARFIKDELYSAGLDESDYQNYNIHRYKTDAEKIFEDSNQLSKYSFDTKILESSPEKLLKIIKEPNKTEVKTFDYKLPDLESIAKNINKLLDKELTRDIVDIVKELENDQDLEQWTREGLRYFDSNDSESCPWCEEKPSTRRIRKLRKHFDDSYEKLHTSIKGAIDEIEFHINEIPDLESYQFLNLFSDLSQEYKTNLDKLDKINSEIRKWFSMALDSLKKKLGKMNEPFALDHQLPDLGENICEKIKSQLENHNSRSKAYHQQRIELCKLYVNKIILEKRDEYISYKSSVDEIQEQINGIDEIIAGIKDEIIELKENAKDSETPLDQLNLGITDFFGHSELQFKDGGEEQGYTIIRGGDSKATPQSISEGEKTAIALLYFLMSIESDNFVMPASIIVFDDPVSSMDSNFLYQAISKINEVASKVAQTFILTHNFSVLSEIKRNVTKKNKSEYKFYILEVQQNLEERTAVIKTLPKVLKDYNSEYYYLFYCLWSIETEQESSVKWHYNLANMSRRFLETFFKFRFPGKHLKAAIEASKLEQYKADCIDRFVNRRSHIDSIDVLDHQGDPLAEADLAVKYILEMVKKLDSNHYNNMVETIKENEPID